MNATRSIIDGIASGVLPETATYDDRAWAWVPCGDPPADGTLTIRQRRTKGRRAELDSYLVEEQPPTPGIMGRVFLLAKQTKGTRAEVYQTIVGPMNWCDCQCGRVGHHECKHIATVRAMMKEEVV
jgi:hypothetical protein